MKTLDLLRFSNICTICLPLAIVLSYLMMALLPDLGTSVPEFVALSAVIIILLSLTCFLGQRTQTNRSAGFIIIVAAIVRFLFLWRAPQLSDDIFRYLFDGLMLLSGHNPFAAAPADIFTTDPRLLSLIGRINHAHIPTIYPPAAQFVFVVGAGIGNIVAMKLCLIFMDLASCLLVIHILDRLELNRVNAVLYAWHPLPVIEIAASGHIDAAAIFFTMAAIALVLSGKSRGYAAGLIFSLAVLTKWVPLIFLPGLLLISPAGSRKKFIFGCLAGGAVMISLFWPEVVNSFQTLSLYAANWEFSGFVFRCLRAATGSGKTARLLIAGGFITAMAILYFHYFKPGPRSPLAKARQALACFYATAILFLLLTPTLHPWYALYLAAFLPFAAGPAGIVFSWSVFLAYRVMILYGLTGQWVENDFIPFLIVAGPAVAFAGNAVILHFKHRKTDNRET